MRLLVVGINGLLGSNVVHSGMQRGWTLCGTYHSQRPDFDIPMTSLDLRSPDTFSEVLAEYDPDVAVNCAGMTDVDGCESNSVRAHSLNAEAPQKLATDCRKSDVEFVHISTDYVFDGTTREPYQESDCPNPKQVYGESKLAGEKGVTTALPTALVVRLAFVWGIHRNEEELTGFPAWVRDRLWKNTSVPLFTDQWVTPTRAGQAAETILDLIERGCSELVHVASSSCVTPYEFGQLIASHLNEGEELLTKQPMHSVERAATRPEHSCLDVRNVESLLGRSQPTVDDDLEAVRLSSDHI